MARFEVFRYRDGNYGWRLRADGGRILATGYHAGEGFEASADAAAAIEEFRREAATATISDKTDV